MKKCQILEFAHSSIASSKRAFLAFTDYVSPLITDSKWKAESQSTELPPLSYLQRFHTQTPQSYLVT